jgi:hypothetical protein
MSNYILAETRILEKEYRIYEHIKLLLRQKQGFLVKSDSDGIKHVTLELEEAILKINSLERERAHLLDNFIAEHLTRPVQDPFLWRKKFPDDETDEKDMTAAFRALDRVKGGLRMIIGEVSELQETNQLLIQQGREVLQACMECLLCDVNTHAYDSKGVVAKQVSNDARLVDRKV